MTEANLDRLGWERCGGYRRQDFRLCSRCFPSNNGEEASALRIERYRLKPDATCQVCGGYGEISVEPPTGVEPALSE